jgi:aspartoacylase
MSLPFARSFTGTFLSLSFLLIGIRKVLSFDPLPPVKRVVVVGGTHGNEYTGVWCIKALDAQQDELRNRYPSLQIETLLANEVAHLANKRFIDTDLNREFRSDTLCSIDNEIVLEHEVDEELLHSVESQRAKELDDILGSKCAMDAEDAFDVAIDLHSTTSNMGITIIINEGDEPMTRGAAYVAHKCENAKILMHSIPEREDRPTLSSAAKHGFTIEVS